MPKVFTKFYVKYINVPMWLSVWPIPRGQVIKDQRVLPSMKIGCANFTAVDNSDGKTKNSND